MLGGGGGVRTERNKTKKEEDRFGDRHSSNRIQPKQYVD
jgi:hypothetical protein